MKEKNLFKIVGGLLILILLASCSSLSSMQKMALKEAKFEAKLKQAKADTLSINRNVIQYYNDFQNPYPFYNRFTAGFQGRYFYQPHPIIIKRRQRHGNNHTNNINTVRNRNRNVNRVTRQQNNRPKVVRRTGVPVQKPVKNKTTVKQ